MTTFGESTAVNFGRQEDQGFRKSRILNQAIAHADGEYLVFLDGDCIASPDYLKRHLELRQAGQFVSGSLIRMPWSVNPLLRDELVTNGEIFTLEWLRSQGCIDRIGTFLKTGSLPKGLANFLERISPVKKVWNGCR